MSIKDNAIIILGASGDLAERKLVPALNRLFEKREIDSSNIIIGSGRSEFTNESFRNKFKTKNEFSSILYYHRGIKGLKDFISKIGNFSEYVIFLALPPSAYADTAKKLHEEGFHENTTLIIEKPFGSDYESSQKLNNQLHKYYDELKLFRIDHYLAKEAVQNILVFRFANSVFYPVWNSGYIESIQINAIEDIGIGSRGQYFDSSGIIRDMVQNHLFQLLALLTMEAPVSLDAEDIRTQKINLLKVLELKECNKYQYEGYHREPGISTSSNTETFAEMKFHINNFRWTGTPVYIRTGKAVHRKGTEIGIKFKKLPRLLFNKDDTLGQNTIIFTIQPQAGIIVNLASKYPNGGDITITDTDMKFCFHKTFDVEIPEAYQKLLLDALKGDRTLFVSAEETETAWQKIKPALNNDKPRTYKKGTLPPSNIKWIDFDKYTTSCSD